MEPELKVVRIDTVTDDATIVEVRYRSEYGLLGVELMGVDAGLSWVKGESISLELEEKDDFNEYVTYLKVDDTCEFRARGFNQDEDYWEAGLENHKIIRNEDGTIEFESELDSDMYFFKGTLPTDLEPDFEIARNRLENIEEEENYELYQIVLDLATWIDYVFENPQKEDAIHPIPAIVKRMKTKLRDKESYLLDETFRPVIHALFDMYCTAMEFVEEDPRLLTGGWENEGYRQLFYDAKDKIRKLEMSQNIGRGKDAGDRYKELLKFLS